MVRSTSTISIRRTIRRNRRRNDRHAGQAVRASERRGGARGACARRCGHPTFAAAREADRRRLGARALRRVGRRGRLELRTHAGRLLRRRARRRAPRLRVPRHARAQFLRPIGRDRARARPWRRLLAALTAQRDAGYAYAIIGGVGPQAYYAKTVGAVPIEGSTPGAYAGLLRRDAAKPGPPR